MQVRVGSELKPSVPCTCVVDGGMCARMNGLIPTHLHTITQTYLDRLRVAGIARAGLLVAGFLHVALYLFSLTRVGLVGFTCDPTSQADHSRFTSIPIPSVHPSIPPSLLSSIIHTHTCVYPVPVATTPGTRWNRSSTPLVLCCKVIVDVRR